MADDTALTPPGPASTSSALTTTTPPSGAISTSTAPQPHRPPYRGPAAGPFAVLNSFRYALKTSGLKRGWQVFREVNQQDGFDCPGCAWPDPAGHRSSFEFCENGARAVAHEADIRRVDAAFFAAHSISSLRRESDYQLEHHGRLTEPMVKRPGKDHYEPIAWDDAFQLVADTLQGLDDPNEAVFYTSGRTSNEAAFLYQLLARQLGTNNLPDCSNMCHESSGKGLSTTIGIGKGTVQLDDFDVADCIFVIGQNPGTNHPRMLSTLRAARARGAAVVVVNPIRERGLQAFAHPQKGLGIIGVGGPIASHWAQVKINGDVAFLKGVMKRVFELDQTRGGGVIDTDFIARHTVGFEAFKAAVVDVDWTRLEEDSGVSRAVMEEIGTLYAESKAAIACWAMGITQHENGVDNVREIVNLLLLRGNLGKPGAGVCPVRGHSNVQGDRTMGIYEAPSEAFLARLDAATGLTSPRAHGYDVVAAIAALERGEAKVFVGMGGNFVAAAPDTPRVDAALRGATLTVQIATKLNRTHLATGEQALLLPCLGRTERDEQAAGPQFVTVENSMGIVHRSEGRLPPVSSSVRSEVAIVCGIAEKLWPASSSSSSTSSSSSSSSVPWTIFASDYDRVRELIERAIPGFANFNDRVRAPDGFLLPNGPRERQFTSSASPHKAAFTPVPLPSFTLTEEQLVLMTIRSHDQYNTTIYEENDRYRGIYGQRQILMVDPRDLKRLGLADGDVVDITSHHQGQTRTVHGFTVLAFELPPRAAAGYFPELNPLVPLERVARESHTPTSKAVIITVQKRAALATR